MKNLCYLSFLFIIMITSQSCKDNSQTPEPSPDWVREQFNSDYTIMTAGNYEGGINQESVGTTFKKTRTDHKVVIFGGFCNPAIDPCYASDYDDYHSEVNENSTDSIAYRNLNGDPDYLNEKIIVSNNQNNIVLFFYTNSHGGSFRDSYGILFFYDPNSSSFRMGGTISFSSTEQQEVLDIVGTIKLG